MRDVLSDYDVDRIREQMPHFIDENGNLTTGMVPPNIFARFASGSLALPPDAQELSEKLPPELRDKFLVCTNRKEADNQWESSAPGVVGKASMSKRHIFITTKNLSWRRFNVLVCGMFGDVCAATTC